MALTQRLEIRQGQSLVMTPQLQQAIKLLQMSNLELQEFVDGELESNRLLERAEARDEPTTEPRPQVRQLADEPPQIATRSSRVAPGSSDSGWASLRHSGGLALDGESEFGAMLVREKTLH